MCGWVQGDAQVLDFGLGATGLAAQEGADAGGELVEVEWLNEVVVGSGVEALHTVLHSIARRDDEHGKRLLARSQGLQYLEAAFARQAEIEQ